MSVSDPRFQRRHNRGFTALEVMVSFGIILVLVSLLLPAVQLAREAARRTRCQNNLKQIGLSLVNYHTVFESYPPGYVSRGVQPSDPATAETGPGYAWATMLLPYLEQSPLAGTMVSELDATDPLNASAMSTVLPTWICASSGSAEEGRTPPVFDVTAGLATFLLASSNYVGMCGVGDLTEAPGSPAGPGVFYRNSYVPEFLIHDGLSTTIAVGERAAWHDFVPNYPGVAANSTWFAAIPGVFRPAGAVDYPPIPVGPGSLVLGAAGLTIPGFEVLRPNHTNHIGAFSSKHVGGLNVSLADSSVRFLSDDIDGEVYRRLAQTSDGGVIGEF